MLSPNAVLPSGKHTEFQLILFFCILLQRLLTLQRQREYAQINSFKLILILSSSEFVCALWDIFR